MNKKPRSGGAGQIRIIGGQWRGRKLPVPDSAGLRPTTDRVRETLFNWLAPDIREARCLDCFAGSGALGLEALSRYAASATLLELERPVAQQLEKNLVTLGATHGRVINTNTLSWLAQPGEPHDLVFIDPPFRKGLLEQTLSLLESHHWLAEGALIYVESEVENGMPPVPANWHLHREKIAGQVAYRLFVRQAINKENDDAA
ncbi:16S rRNA (guanine(966)-N(2))-methyltransferase [Pantoea sp. B65]|uniref:16S rRNA (guanine(966)-N(2))-methyltransferase n=1 Tax=Pantoea sp. B65 TaxID=2813359 RepID=UPI0039B6A229